MDQPCVDGPPSALDADIPPSQRVTLRDVARTAYVSLATASLSLRDRPGVSETTRHHVKSVATSLGYRPDSHAVMLRAGPRPIVGIALHADTISAEHRTAYSELVFELGRYGVLIGLMGPHSPSPAVDVLIAVTSGGQPAPKAVRFGTPVVTLDLTVGGHDGDQSGVEDVTREVLGILSETGNAPLPNSLPH